MTVALLSNWMRRCAMRRSLQADFVSQKLCSLGGMWVIGANKPNGNPNRLRKDGSMKTMHALRCSDTHSSAAC